MFRKGFGNRLSLFRVMLATAIVAGMMQGAGAATPAYGASVTVTTTADSGPGSLRDAITRANATNAKDTIKFNIVGTVAATITLTSDLPPIAKPIIIDGTTQPGYISQPVIWIDGASSYACLALDPGSDGSTIKAVSVGNCDSPNIRATGSGGHTFQNNFLGTFEGQIPEPNVSFFDDAAIFLDNSDDNQIGGDATGEGNLISGMESSGIRMLSSDGNVVQGNLIGTDLTGGQTLGNSGDGIHLDGSGNNVIGGTTAGARNIIADFNWGINIENIGANGNVVQGNYIGTDSSGQWPLQNDSSGISIGQSVTGTLIGGSEPGAGNLISGNNWAGISIYSNSPGGNVIQGNLIGTDASGTKAIGNHWAGIELSSYNNTIGGSLPGEGNVISSNWTDGIRIGSYDPTLDNVIQGNFIGTDVTHTLDIGNNINGISVINGDNTLIGGAEEDAGNWIMFNDDKGLYVADSAITVQGNRIRRNHTGILLDPGGSFALNTENCISNNVTFGLRNLSGVLTTAEGNWWGSNTGPTNGANPAGTGEKVGANIDFDPWVETSCVELLDNRALNGGFELDSNADLLPDDWTGTNLTLGAADDGQDCAVAQSGICSFRIEGNGKTKKITQSIATNGAANEDVTVSVYSLEDNVPAAANYKLTMTITHVDGSKQTTSLNLPTGTSAVFGQHSAILVTTTEPYDEIEVVIEYAKASGTVWLDLVAAIVQE